MKTVILNLMGVLTNSDEEKILQQMGENLMTVTVSENYRKLKYGGMELDAFWDFMGYEREEGEEKLLSQIQITTAVREQTAYLKRKNYILVLLTDLPREWTEKLIRLNSLGPLFDKIEHVKDWSASIKHAQLYQSLKREYEDAVFVDTDAGHLKQAQDAGMETVWLNPRKEEGSFRPDIEIRNINQLKENL